MTQNWITTKQQVGTGAACPPSTKTKSCPATAVCAVDCQGYYTDPACPTACGTAASSLIKRWVTTTSPVGTGAACPSPSTKSCPATEVCPVPVDCEGKWVDGGVRLQHVKTYVNWGGYTIANKTKIYKYKVTKPATNGGKSCPHEDGETKEENVGYCQKSGVFRTRHPPC